MSQSRCGRHALRPAQELTHTCMLAGAHRERHQPGSRRGCCPGCPAAAHRSQREALEGVLEFVTRRLEQLLVDEGCGIEVIKAVLSERGANPTIAAQSARELQVGSRTPHLTCRQHLVHVGCSCSTLPAWRRHGSKCIVAFRWLMSIFHICAFLLCECWMAARRYLLCCPCCCSSRKRSGQHVLQPT